MISKLEFENQLVNPSVVEYFSGLTKEELENLVGSQVATMFKFKQNNSHHCYDLLMHSLKTVEGIKPEGLTEEQFKMLKVAAFFHDVAKPQVAKFNEKTKQQVFYGHSIKSAEVSAPILTQLGYSPEEISKLSFLIAHHDDFISYKSDLQPFMFNHMFIRGITPQTVAEKILENKYDFIKMGYTEEEVKGILVALIHNKKPFFKTKDRNYNFTVDMKTVKQKMASGKFNTEYTATVDDYKLLLKLCVADASAQAEIVVQDGKVVDSKKDKVKRINKIEDCIESAFELTETVCSQLGNELK